MGDLVIGQRRIGQPRPWRAAVIGLGLCGAAVVAAWFIFERSVTYELPDGEVGGAVQWLAPARPGERGALAYRSSRLTWRGGLPVLHLEGSVAELGAARGRLLGPELERAAPSARAALAALVRGRGSWASLTHELRVAWRLRFLDDGLGDSDRKLLAGMVRGTGAAAPASAYQTLVHTQAVWDVGVPVSESEPGGLTRTLAIAALQEPAAGGRAWLGHSFAAPGLLDGGEELAPVVTFAKPTSGLAWAAVGSAGSAGALVGINAKGLAIAVAPARTRDVRPTRTARPILLLARSVLEQSSTLDEAIRALENAATLGAASYLVMSGPAGRWAVVERSPTRAVVTRASGAVALGDALAAPAFASDPDNDRTRRQAPGAPRVTRAEQLLRAPLAQVEQVAAILRDRRDVSGTERTLGHRGTIYDPAAQVVIVDPVAMAMWVADPLANGRLRAFDLRHELLGQGERPAPPPDVLAPMEPEADRLAEVVEARRALRQARQALARGELVPARQLAARALARAPELPEALVLAGELAALAGDQPMARTLWQRWIDGGPDDPDRAQRVRNILATDRGW